MANPAYAVNAVIISDDGRTVRYRARCPKCGYVDMMMTSQTFVSGGIVTIYSSCRNMKCKESFTIQFSRN